MPYADPERKRQWERDHREERNARRRVGRDLVIVRSESVQAARLRAQKRQWWRENRAKWPVVVRVAP